MLVTLNALVTPGAEFQFESPSWPATITTGPGPLKTRYDPASLSRTSALPLSTV